MISSKDMTNLFLDADIFVACLIKKTEEKFWSNTGEAGLLKNPLFEAGFPAFFRIEMAGYRSIPKMRPEFLVPASFGLHQSILMIKNHDEKGAVQDAFPLMAGSIFFNP